MFLDNECDASARKLCQEGLAATKALLAAVASSPLGASVDKRLAALQARLRAAEIKERKATEATEALRVELRAKTAAVSDAEFRVEKNTNEVRG